MPRTIRFHLDENCSGAIAVGLRRQGIDVTTTSDAGLIGADDPEHIAYALPLGRVIFTQDGDFLGLYRSGMAHAGIAYCPKDSRRIGDILDFLTLIWEVFEPDEMANRVEFL